MPSFDDFLAERLDGLLRYATTLTGDPHLAQDIVQEVLLRAQQRWHRIDSPPTYIRRMITNEYLSWRRRKAVRSTVPSPPATLDELSPPVADPSAHYHEREAMRQRLATLPRKQRAAVVLRYYENQSDGEIAALLGCRASTVRSQISRALRTLRAAETAAAAQPTGVSR